MQQSCNSLGEIYYELLARNTLNNTHENGWSGIMQEGVVWSITGYQPVEYYLYIARGLQQLVLQPSLGFLEKRPWG